MKILMSGMSTRTVGSQRLKIDYLNFNPLLKKALEALGHEVDQRRLTYGEDLSSYDAAFLHVTPIDKIVCQNVPEVCYALDQMRDRACVFLEDWVACELRRAVMWNLNTRYDKWLGWKQYTDLPQEAKDLMKRILLEIVDPGQYGPWPVIANFYGWGQASAFFKNNFNTERCMIIDPSAMAVIPTFIDGPRVNRWVLATLQKHDDWVSRQGFTWPIEFYGNHRQGQEVLQEDAVTQRYAWSWGVLAPKYPVIGWFRPRYLLAAATGTPLFCDPSEGVYLGGSYQVKSSKIERMTEFELRLLATEQAQALKARIWGKERLFEELNFLLGFLRGGNGRR